MRIHTFIIAIAVSVFYGCAVEHYVAGHGDVGQFILQRAISAGRSPTTTNGLPAITSRWRYSEDEHGVVVFMSRGDYPAAESFLTRAFAGQQQFGPEEGSDGSRILEYHLIQLSRDETGTHVVILRRSLLHSKSSDSP